MIILQIFMMLWLNDVVWMHLSHQRNTDYGFLLLKNCFDTYKKPICYKFIFTVLGRPINSRRKSSLVAVVIHFLGDSCTFFCPCTFVWILKSFKIILWFLSCYLDFLNCIYKEKNYLNKDKHWYFTKILCE